jgi:hypothetical protein
MGADAMTEEQKDKPTRRKSKDRKMLEAVLEVMEVVESDCRHVHTWQFYRQRQGEPDSHIFNRTVKELRDYLTDG